MTVKPFASSADLGEKEEPRGPGDGVYALTAEGDPNVGAIEGEDFVVAFEARATPLMAGHWLDQLREHTDKPVKYLVLSPLPRGPVARRRRVRRASHHRARADPGADRGTGRGRLGLRGRADAPPVQRRRDHPRPHLAGPDVHRPAHRPPRRGRGDLVLQYCGRGHTAGDIVAWLPRTGFSLPATSSRRRPRCTPGDAFHRDWSTGTLDRVAALGAEVLVGGRGAVATGRDAVEAAIDQTRSFLTTHAVATSGRARGGAER